MLFFVITKNILILLGVDKPKVLYTTPPYLYHEWTTRNGERETSCREVCTMKEKITCYECDKLVEKNQRTCECGAVLISNMVGLPL